MELSLILGKVAGIYLIVVGISLLLRHEMWMYVVRKFSKSTMFIVIVALFELILGLLIITMHNVWVPSWAMIVTVIGWLMTIEAILYLLLPSNVLKQMVRSFNKPGWLLLCGFASLLLGSYLTYIVFSFSV